MLADMVVAIVGSRAFADRGLMLRVVAGLREEFGEALEVISGGAPGADTLAIEAAMTLGVREREILPDEARWADRAHSLRNQALADAADLVVAFFAPGPRSPGTSETLRMAAARGIPARVFHDGHWSDG
jgi:hypothetical protein